MHHSVIIRSGDPDVQMGGMGPEFRAMRMQNRVRVESVRFLGVSPNIRPHQYYYYDGARFTVPDNVYPSRLKYPDYILKKFDK